MKAVSVQQPWASAAVFGGLEVLSLGFKARHTGLLLIHAAGVDSRVMTDPQARERLARYPHREHRDALLGVVNVTGVTEAAACDLPFAVGPWCWLVDNSAVFPDPVPWPRLKGVEKILDTQVTAALEQAVPAREYLRQLEVEAQAKRERERTEEQVYGRRRPGDNWVGD